MLYGLSILICRGMAIVVTYGLVARIWMAPAYLLTPEMHVADRNIYACILITHSVFAALLWFRAPWLGKKIIRDIPESVLRQSAPVKYEELATLGTTLIGLLILSWSIEPLIRGIPYLIKDLAGDNHNLHNWSQAVQGMAVLVMGLLLLFRPYGLAKMLNWLRKKT